MPLAPAPVKARTRGLALWDDRSVLIFFNLPMSHPWTSESSSVLSTCWLSDPKMEARLKKLNYLEMSEFKHDSLKCSCFPFHFIKLVPWLRMSRSLLINVGQTKVVKHYSRAMSVVFFIHCRIKREHVTTILRHLFIKRKVITNPIRSSK